MSFLDRRTDHSALIFHTWLWVLVPLEVAAPTTSRAPWRSSVRKTPSGADTSGAKNCAIVVVDEEVAVALDDEEEEDEAVGVRDGVAAAVATRQGEGRRDGGEAGSSSERRGSYFLAFISALSSHKLSNSHLRVTVHFA